MVSPLILLKISHGVSERSVLCPLLFILFINDLPNSSSIFYHELNNVNNWLTSNRICIIADKTKYIIFAYGKLLHLTNIKIVSATIEETNNIKFLEIIFDEHLTFRDHVDVIAPKYLNLWAYYSNYLNIWH